MQGAAGVLALACAGAAGVCASDIIRALRFGSRAEGFIGGILDFASIAAGGAALWLALLAAVHGELRLYWIMCVAAGAALYIFTIKKVVYKLFCVIFQNIFKFFYFILKILLTPVRFLYKMICVGLYTHTHNKKGDDTDVQKA